MNLGGNSNFNTLGLNASNLPPVGLQGTGLPMMSFNDREPKVSVNPDAQPMGSGIYNQGEVDDVVQIADEAKDEINARE